MPELKIAQLVMSNADLEVSATGTWRAPATGAEGPGTADLSARIARLDVRHAHRYVPLVRRRGHPVMACSTHCARASSTDGTLRIRGDLARFPYPTPATGEFRAVARLRDVVLDVAPATGPNGERTPGTPWPLIRDIDADLVFERQGMTLQRAARHDRRCPHRRHHRAHPRPRRATPALEVSGQVDRRALRDRSTTSTRARWPA